MLELEQRLEVVREHRAALELQHRRVGRAGAHHLEHRLEVDALAPGDHERLRERRAVDGGDGVGDHLDLLAAPHLADVHDPLAHRLEQRPRALDVLLRAAGHDRQRAVLGLRRGAGHRRVDEAVAALAQGGAEAAGVGGRDRRHVDEQGTGPRGGERAVLAQQQLLDLAAVDDHRDHDVAALGQFAGGGGDAAAVLGRPRVGLLARAVVDGQLEAGARQVGRLPRSHDAQPDEADRFRHGGGG